MMIPKGVLGESFWDSPLIYFSEIYLIINFMKGKILICK
jgi:hypothetical protein